MIQIKQAVQNGNFELAELNELGSFINSVKVLNAKSSISVGDKVYVVQKTKRTLGVVEKVKVKNALVTLPQGRYNVPLSMLEVA
jgi:predicted RNA-binding protein with PUA domain